MAGKVINKGNMILFCFTGIMFLKLGCMCCFSSDYQDALFYPFVSHFLDGKNPYEYYYRNRMVSAFPYPPFMLYIESIFVLITRVFSVKNLFLLHFILKLPVFLFDNLCTVVLWKLFPEKTKYIILLYYASPIIIYSGYMHGQLDMIPTAILLLAIYLMMQDGKRSFVSFTFFLAASILTKQHTAAVVPILYLFLIKRKGFKKSLCSFIGLMAVSVIGFLPFWSDGFVYGVLFNQEQNRIMNVYIDYDTLKFIIPIFMILILYLKAFYLERLNRELLLNYCGIIFAVFLAFVAPMPGWYTWIVPFITIFFINSGQDKYKNFVVYLALNGSYLLYFVFFHDKKLTDLYFCGKSLSYIKSDNQVLQNQIFTVMTGLLLYIIYQMYHLGIASNSLYKRGNIPFAIGISGDSGSGKSQMLYMLEQLFGKKNVLKIEGDGDHKWERGEEMWKFHTHLDPKANYLYRQAGDIQMLKQGKSVYRVDYQHETGVFSKPHKIRPRKIIIVCGLHSLYLPQMRKCLDMKIYMDTQECLRKLWKIRRDTAKRGYSDEKILKQVENRMADSKRYILPQKEYADIVIRFFDAIMEEKKVSKDYVPEISLKITLSSEIDLEAIIADLQDSQVLVQHEYERDLDKQTVTVDGASISASTVKWYEIAHKNIPQIEELTMQTPEMGMNGLQGIIALFILAGMSSMLRQ